MSMARQHESKPVTKADKIMSERHHRHRDEVERMPAGKAKEDKSHHYNLSHAGEHIQASKLEDHKKRLITGILNHALKTKLKRG